MEKKMEITGMMCGHCEASVKKALEDVAGVDHAEVSHEKGEAIVFLKEEVEEIMNGKEDAVEELCELIKKIM